MAGGWIERLRPHWKLVAVGTLVALAGIGVAKSNYASLQLASTPNEFVEELDGESGRAMLAGVFDLLFAFGYGALGLIGLRAHGRGRRVAAWAAVAVVIGVAGDQLENGLVIANAAQHDSIDQTRIDVMGGFGAIKWVAQLGNLVLLVLLALNWSADRRGSDEVGSSQ